MDPGTDRDRHEYGRKVKAKGKVHGYGPPHGHVAAAFVEGMVEALKTEVQDNDQPMQHVTKTRTEFMEKLDQPWGPTFVTE
eukprot:7038255-Pyramimonas_sp.AAC.1